MFKGIYTYYEITVSSHIRASFNIYTGGDKAPPPPPAPVLAPPLKGFGPPSKSPFYLKMSENHVKIAGNQVVRAQKYKNFLGRTPRPPKRYTSPHFLFSLKSLFVVGSSTEKSLKEALSHISYIQILRKLEFTNAKCQLSLQKL